MKGKSVIPVNYENIEEGTIERITQIVEDSLKNGASSITVKHQTPVCEEYVDNKLRHRHQCNIKPNEYANFKVNVTYFA